jgi:hypothetical protein
VSLPPAPTRLCMPSWPNERAHVLARNRTHTLAHVRHAGAARGTAPSSRLRRSRLRPCHDHAVVLPCSRRRRPPFFHLGAPRRTNPVHVFALEHTSACNLTGSDTPACDVALLCFATWKPVTAVEPVLAKGRSFLCQIRNLRCIPELPESLLIFQSTF